MHAHFTELTYSREATHYARFRRKTDNPLDPEFRPYPIIAREQGTMVGHEQIEALLEEFGMELQRFRDAFNAFYELVPPAID
jgi:hypothetical protein